MGSTGSDINAVSSESRPNRAMNQGAPAATTARSGCDGSKMRREPRSSWLCRMTRSIASSSIEGTGMRDCHARKRRAGAEGAEASESAPIEYSS